MARRAREDMMALRTSQGETDEIAHFYVLRDDNSPAGVSRLIERYPVVADVLLDARDALRHIFPGSAYYLRMARDPDTYEDQLVLSIGIKRDPANPRDGVRRLLLLQEEWGLDADRRTEGKLVVVLESL